MIIGCYPEAKRKYDFYFVPIPIDLKKNTIGDCIIKDGSRGMIKVLSTLFVPGLAVSADRW